MNSYPYRNPAPPLWPAWIMLAIAFASALLWRWWCVPYGDDYIYSHVFEVESLSRESDNWLGAPIASLNDAFVSIYRHYLSGPGRLANCLCFFLPLLPGWLVLGLSALSVAAQPLLVAMAADGVSALRRSALLALLYILMWILLPWHDHMQSVVFLLNYVFSSCAMLTAMIMFDRVASLSRAFYAGCALFTVLAGWMHEGFTVALVAYMFGRIVLSGLTTRLICLLLCALIGFVLSFSPGTYGRLGETPGFSVHLSVQDMVLLIPTALFALLSIWMLIRDWRRRKAIFRDLTPYWLAIGANLMVVVVSRSSMRGLWPAIIITLVGVWSILCRESSPSRRGGLWVPLALVYVAMMWILTVDQRQVSDIHQRVHPLMVEAVDNIIYCDSSEAELSWLSRGVPLAHKYSDWLNLHFENQAAGHQGMPVILPTSLSGKTFDEWPDVPGENSFKGTIAHMVSADSLDGIQLRVVLGASLRSRSPMQRLASYAFSHLRGGDECVVEPQFDRIGVFSGDTLYRVSFTGLNYIFADREIISVDELRPSLK